MAGVDHTDEQALLELGEEGASLLQKAKANVPPVSPAIESPVSDLIRKLATWRRAELERQSAGEELTRLDERIGDPARFSAALESYRRRFVQNENLEKLRTRTETDMEVFARIREVETLLAQAAREPLSRISVETARRMLPRCKTLLASSGKIHPAKPLLEQYAHVLELTAGRVVDDVWITDDINAVLGKPLILRVQAAVARKNNETVRYYFRGTPRFLSTNAWSIPAFVDFDMEDTKSVKIDQKDLLNPIRPGGDAKKSVDWTAPQRRVADLLVERISRVKLGGDWEREFAGAIQDIDAEPHLEPLLKVQLLNLVAEVAAKGSLFMKEAFAPELALLQNVPADLFDAEWIWPDDEEGKDARAKIGMLLKQTRPMKTILDDADRRRKTFEAAIDRRLDWIGYLWPDDDSINWTCRTRAVDPSLSGDLFVFVTAESPRPVDANTGAPNTVHFEHRRPGRPEPRREHRRRQIRGRKSHRGRTIGRPGGNRNNLRQNRNGVQRRSRCSRNSRFRVCFGTPRLSASRGATR